MGITFKKVEEYLQNNRIKIENSKDRIVNIFTQKMISDELRIHSCTGRTKSAESIYLKIKRKQKNSFDEITDYAGVRILCLCEQDIFEVHKFIVSDFDSASNLIEFTAYNWKDKKYFDVPEELHFDLIDKKYKGILVPENLRSSEGYRSLHYVILVNDVFVEIQLRTVIQNVWAELGHNMAYKDGNASKYVTQNFRVIADHLEAIDSVITSVRDANDKGASFAAECMKKLGPVQIFTHDSYEFDAQITDGSYGRYVEHLASRKNVEKSKITEWIQEGIDLFELVKKQLDPTNSSAMFWMNCEEAYWKFCKGKQEEALSNYEQIYLNSEFNKNEHFAEMAYLIQYRIGEINFLEGRVKNAFEAFDECEELIPNNCKNQNGNIYKVFNLLAYHYWRLGKFYSKQALDYMDEAAKYSDTNTPLQKVNYENSRTWYLLELYLIEKNKIDSDKETIRIHLNELQRSHTELKRLISELDESKLNTNMFHTLACVSYEIYRSFSNSQKPSKKIYIDEAYEYCIRCLDNSNGNNKAFHLDHSAMLQRESLQEVMHYYAHSERLIN